MNFSTETKAFNENSVLEEGASEPDNNSNPNEHKFKLANALPITIFAIITLLIGGYFERTLESLYQDTITINLYPSHDDEEDNQSEKSTPIAPALISITEKIFNAITSNEDLDKKDVLTENFGIKDPKEKLIITGLVAKKLRLSKQYELALELIVGLSQKEQEAQNLIFSKAFCLSKLGHYDAAIINYKHLLVLEPLNQSANLNLGLLYLKQSNFELAQAVFEKGISQSSGIKKAKNYAGLATSFFRRGQYKMAIENYRKSIEYRPTHSGTWRKMALSEVSSGQYVIASESFQNAISLEPKSLFNRLAYADYLYSRLDYIGAIEQLKIAKKINRESYQVRQKLALAYLFARKPINARRQLNLAKNSIHKDYQRNQSESLIMYMDKEYSSAIEQLKRNLKGSEQIDLENFLIAVNYLALKRKKDSVKYLERLPEESLFYSSGQYFLAEAYIDSGNTQEAVRIFEHLTNGIPDNTRLLLQAAKALQEAKLYPQALELVDKALKINQTKQLMLRKARLLWLDKDSRQAVALLEIIIDKYPSYLRARYHLANYNHKMGNIEVARDVYEQLLDIGASYGDSLYQLSKVYFKLKEFNKSNRLLAEYLLIKPSSKRTRLLYAQTFCEMGQSLECKEQLELILKLDPSYEEAIKLSMSLDKE